MEVRREATGRMAVRRKFIGREMELQEMDGDGIIVANLCLIVFRFAGVEQMYTSNEFVSVRCFASSINGDVWPVANHGNINTFNLSIFDESTLFL